MAGSLAPSDFVLIDNFPGYPNLNAPQPAGGFDNTVGAGNRATTAAYPVGTKIQKYQDTSVGKLGSSVANKGYYTMMYTGMYDYTNAADASNGKICMLACGSTKARGGVFVTQDGSGGNITTAGHHPSSAAAIPCTSLAASFATPTYGWFWVGGVCPNGDISGLDITGFLMDDTAVFGGEPIGLDYDNSVAKLAAIDNTAENQIGFALGDGSA